MQYYAEEANGFVTPTKREHNETLAKLNFVLALVDCILELARSRAAPIMALRQTTAMRESVSATGTATLSISNHEGGSMMVGDVSWCEYSWMQELVLHPIQVEESHDLSPIATL